MDQAKGVRYQIVQIRSQEPITDFLLAEYRTLYGYAIYDTKHNEILTAIPIGFEAAEQLQQALNSVNEAPVLRTPPEDLPH